MVIIAQNTDEVRKFRGEAVVIDFFRFSTTLTALCLRSKVIRIFSDEKKAILKANCKSTDIFSEKKLNVDKFDNSPYLAYTSNLSDMVFIVIESGSKAVMACVSASKIIIASLSNITAAKYLKSSSQIMIIPACIFFNTNHFGDFIFSEMFKKFIEEGEIDVDFII